MIGDGDVVNKSVVFWKKWRSFSVGLWWVYKLWLMMVSYYYCGSIAY